MRAGFCFTNPRNRFWSALNASRLVDAPLEPGPEAVVVLVGRYGIGFTDIVKRPTAGSAELRPREFREGAARLEALVGQGKITEISLKSTHFNFVISLCTGPRRGT